MRFVCLMLFGLPVFFTSLTMAEVKYQRPEPLVDDLVRADSFSSPLINGQEDALIKMYYKSMPSIDYVSRLQVKLGGLRFNPQNYAAISNYYVNRLSYFDVKAKKESVIPFPKEAILRHVSWSPDGKNLVVSLEKENCVELWIIEIPTLLKKKIPGVCLNSILKKDIEWVGSSKILFSMRTKEQAKALFLSKETPKGPVVLESQGIVTQNRTYTDLLKTPEDENYFEKVLTSQAASYDLSTKKVISIGRPGIFKTLKVSPGKTRILANKIQRPFSYVVPYYYFASQAEVWNMEGKIVHEFTKIGPFEAIPIDGVPTGPRQMGWIGQEKNSLVYVEALDKGDWAVKTPFRDEIFQVDVGEKSVVVKSITKLANRFDSIEFLDHGSDLLIRDYERDKEWQNTFLLAKKNEEWQTKTLFSMSVNDDYNFPGVTYKRRNEMGKEVVAYNPLNHSIYFFGNGATPKGERPFLKEVNLETLAMNEVFRSSDTSYETFESFLFHDFNSFMTTYESQTESPRVMAHVAGKIDFLYADKNPYEIFSKIKKEIITYKRKDGVLLSGILYYPKGFEAGKKYPAIIQAYPLEYTDASVAGQVRGAQNRFAEPFRLAISYNALRGYVVLDEAQMPIIGHPETKNDTFIEQLTSGAKAAVDALNDRGIIDPKKVGVIGHSYGAFMVANLLTHSDLFATGIARSGAYNRTLTPNGFQGERRTFWKARETYMAMSPFVHVEKMKKPIMLIHGMADNNPGTFTLQSERYYEALKGQGAVVKMVLLPEESHSYEALESVEHVLYETFNWFDKYLKGN